MDTKKIQIKNDVPYLEISSIIDLKGRQSVRATFKLTEKAVSAVSVVAAHLGIKQKSLFDHLMGDLESLKLTAQNIRPKEFKQLHHIQKTYVLSRKTLLCIEEASKSLDLPRDALVEYSIKRLLPIIDVERKNHQNRKIILSEIMQYLRQGEKLLSKSKALLGEDDPLFEKFMKTLVSFRNTQKGLRSFIEDGDIIEDF